MAMIRSQVMFVAYVGAEVAGAAAFDNMSKLTRKAPFLMSLLIQLCDLLTLNMAWAIRRKIHLNGVKYPVDRSRGNCRKYTDHSNATGVTKTEGQVMVDSIIDDAKITTNDNNHFWLMVNDLSKKIREFSEARKWDKTHTKRNLALSMTAEIGELAEVFQWFPDEKKQKVSVGTLDKAAQEIADVTIYFLRLGDVCSITDQLCYAPPIAGPATKCKRAVDGSDDSGGEVEQGDDDDVDDEGEEVDYSSLPLHEY